MATRRTLRRQTSANLRGNLRRGGTSSQKARIPDLQQLHRVHRKAAIGCQSQTETYLSRCVPRQDGDIGIPNFGNQGERPSYFIRYREGVPPLQTTPRDPKMIPLQNQRPLLPLYRTPVWIEAFSILLFHSCDRLSGISETA